MMIYPILAVALVLRLIQLGTAPFWYDEAFSALVANLDFLHAVEAIAGDVHPPLYYLLLWPLGQLGIRAEWAYRLPSVVASVLSVWVCYLILVKQGYPRPAIYAAVGLMALAPSQLHYAQEARMYAPLALAVLLAYYALISERRAWYAVALVALLYLHNYGALYALCLGVVDLLRQRRLTWGMVAGYAIPGLLFLPWFVLVSLAQMGDVAQGYWIQPLKWGTPFYALYMSFGSFSIPDIAQPVSMLVFWGLLLLALARLREAEHRPPAWVDVLILGFGPLLIAVAISLAWRPVLLFRALIPSAPFLFALMTYRIAQHSRPMQIYAAALLVPLLIAGIAGHYLYNAPNKAAGDLAQQVAYIRYLAPNEVMTTPGRVRTATILHTNDSSWVGWAWYAPEQNNLRIIDPACDQRTLGALSPRTRRGLGVVEVAPDQLTEPFFVAWSIGPTASICDAQQVKRLLVDSEKVIEVSNEYVEAGLWLSR